MRDDLGTLRGFAKVTRDLTDRRNAEESARRLLQEEAARKAAEEAAETIEQQREHLQVTLASIGDGVIVTDPNGKIQTMNAVAEKLTGWKEAEAETKGIEEVIQVSNMAGEETENPVMKVIAPMGINRIGHLAYKAKDH